MNDEDWDWYPTECECGGKVEGFAEDEGGASYHRCSVCGALFMGMDGWFTIHKVGKPLDDGEPFSPIAKHQSDQRE